MDKSGDGALVTPIGSRLFWMTASGNQKVINDYANQSNLKNVYATLHSALRLLMDHVLQTSMVALNVIRIWEEL